MDEVKEVVEVSDEEEEEDEISVDLSADEFIDEDEEDEIDEFIVEATEAYITEQFENYYRRDFYPRLAEYVSEAVFGHFDILDAKDMDNVDAVRSRVRRLVAEYLDMQGSLALLRRDMRTWPTSVGYRNDDDNDDILDDDDDDDDDDDVDDDDDDVADIAMKIRVLDDHCSKFIQHKQRSREWYLMRQNQFTASSICRLFSPVQAVRMLEEMRKVREDKERERFGAEVETAAENDCGGGGGDENKTPDDTDMHGGGGGGGGGGYVAYEVVEEVNYLNSSTHWGVKYEAVTKMVYEHVFGTVVREYGYVPHMHWDFIGASPDGINVAASNVAKFGRLVEIKNVVNREIEGVPSNEYWIQMQVQMEVCDLPACDFVETKIVEFQHILVLDGSSFVSAEQQFYDDDDDDVGGVKYMFDARNEQEAAAAVAAVGGKPNRLRGVVLHFLTGTQQAVYEYVPVELLFDPAPWSKKRAAVEEWVRRTKEINSGLYLFDVVYWHLEIFSCVRIERNKTWFDTVLPKIHELWRAI